MINSAGNEVTGKACSLTFGVNTDGSGAAWNVKVTVSTTETSPVTWRAAIDLADLTKFPFRAKYVGEYTGGAVVGPVASAFCSGTGRVVILTGRASYGWDTVTGGSGRTLDLVGNSNGGVPNPVYSCP
ncbi:hypothetical protein [Cellulomonas sp.]